MRVRRLAPPDRRDIERLLVDGATFNDEEVRVALEVIDAAIAEPGKDYHVLVGLGEGDGGRVLSYICFGPTPMTEQTWDLYWLATHPEARGQGLGTRLVRAMEAELAAKGSCIVRVETSQMEAYGAARSFYARAGYSEMGRIPDFYKPGDDLIILAKRLEARAQVTEPPRGPRVVVERDSV
jgi:ribosomal protein S18 acetylase RimI-like enzyme